MTSEESGLPVPELPPTGHSEQTGSNDIKLLGTVEPASRIVALGSRLLDFDLGRSVGVWRGRHVLALHAHLPTARHRDVEVRLAVGLDEHGVPDGDVGPERPLE